MTRTAHRYMTTGWLVDIGEVHIWITHYDIINYKYATHVHNDPIATIENILLLYRVLVW